MDKLLIAIPVMIYATLLYTPPLLYASLGSCFSELSGITNIGIEGMMTIGAFTSCTVASFTNNPFFAFLCGGIAGGIFGLLHAIASTKFNADQTISGAAINLLAPGIAIMLSYHFFGSSDTLPLTNDQKIPILFKDYFDINTNTGWLLKNIFSTYISTYLVFILVFVVWFIIKKTKFGLRMRGCGEHPKACETLGINVYRIRILCVILSGFLAGLGGSCMTMAITNQFRPVSIVGQGYIAIAAVIFGNYNPIGAMLGCLLFGFCAGLKVVIGSGKLSAQIISMIPYVVTIAVLIVFHGKAHTPKANGKPYIRNTN